MPKFSDRQLSPEEKRDIVAYVRMAAEAPNPGGYGLGGFGPDLGGHGHLDHRNRGRHRGGPVDRSPGMSDDVKATRPTDAELADDVARGAARARRQDRRRRDRLQGGPLAGPGHQGREARRALGGELASAGRPFGSGAAAGLPVLAVGVQGQGNRGRLLVRPGHAAVRRDVRAVDPGDRHRRGAVPEEVHPRRDLHPGPPRRPLPRDPPQDRRGQPRPMRWRAQRSSGASWSGSRSASVSVRSAWARWWRSRAA